MALPLHLQGREEAPLPHLLVKGEASFPAAELWPVQLVAQLRLVAEL